MVVVCQKCGLPFSDGINIRNARHVTLSGNVAICPRCGTHVEGLSGTFDFDDNGIAYLLADPEFDVATLKQIRSIIEKTKNEGYTPEKIEKELEPVNSKAAVFFTKYITKENINFVIGIITFLILLKQEFFNTENDTQKEFIEYLKQENRRYNEEVKRLNRIVVKKDSILTAGNYPLNKPCPCGSNRQYKRCHGAMWR